MALLQPEPRVPGVLTARVAGDPGEAIVCAPSEGQRLLLMVERDRLSIHIDLGSEEARRLANALLEGADVVGTNPAEGA